MHKLVLFSIRLYQKFLSPDTGFLLGIFPHACRFTPRCSEYAYQAVQKYGILHGSLVSLKRLLRCRPGVEGGPDPIPIFRSIGN